jgi:hypothetical protein
MTHENQTPTQWLQQARDLIAQDRLDEALGLLRSLLGHSPQLEEILQQSGRFAAIRRQIRLGTVSHAEANLTRNQISHALLELLREIEAQEREKPALQQEMQGAIAILHSKNVVLGTTITAGGDVHIGDIIIHGATDSTLTLRVDGQLQEVERKLDTVLALLQSRHAQSIQTADKIYNIGAITNANFEMIVGQSAQSLSLPADLAHYHHANDNLWVQSLRQELLRQGVSVGSKPMTIFQHYGWLIETFLQKMGTPAGKERTPRRLAFMAETYQSALRYLCCIQVSQIFQEEQEAANPVISDFINLKAEDQARYDYLNLLLLCADMVPSDRAFMPEIQDFVRELQDPRTDLYGTALFLEKYRRELLASKTPQGDALETLLDEYLTALVFWLRKLAFLARYRLVSIKDISLSYRLGTAKNFVHLYGELHGMYSEALSDGEDYSAQSVEDVFTYNQSVLLFRGTNMDNCFERIHDPGSYLSLSPLVVDQSVYADKATQTPEIFYFVGVDGSGRQYHFAQYKNELEYDGQAIGSNKRLLVKAQNNQQPRLDELHEQLEKVFQPFKSPAR